MQWLTADTTTTIPNILSQEEKQQCHVLTNTNDVNQSNNRPIGYSVTYVLSLASLSRLGVELRGFCTTSRNHSSFVF
jgi:hypothetical protein